MGLSLRGVSLLLARGVSNLDGSLVSPGDLFYAVAGNLVAGALVVRGAVAPR